MPISFNFGNSIQATYSNASSPHARNFKIAERISHETRWQGSVYISGHESFKVLISRGSATNLERQLSYTLFLPVSTWTEKASCSPFYRPNDCSVFEPYELTNRILPLVCSSKLSLSVYFFAQSSFSSGILFLRVVRREWSDAIQFEKIRENNQGVGSRRRGGDEKQYFNRGRGGFVPSSAPTRTPPLQQ